MPPNSEQRTCDYMIPAERVHTIVDWPTLAVENRSRASLIDRFLADASRHCDMETPTGVLTGITRARNLLRARVPGDLSLVAAKIQPLSRSADELFCGWEGPVNVEWYHATGEDFCRWSCPRCGHEHTEKR